MNDLKSALDNGCCYRIVLVYNTCGHTGLYIEHRHSHTNGQCDKVKPATLIRNQRCQPCAYRSMMTIEHRVLLPAAEIAETVKYHTGIAERQHNERMKEREERWDAEWAAYQAQEAELIPLPARRSILDTDPKAPKQRLTPVGDGKRNDECSICRTELLDPSANQYNSVQYNQPVQIDCPYEHRFHRGCIQTWLNNGPGKKCSTCKLSKPVISRPTDWSDGQATDFYEA